MKLPKLGTTNQNLACKLCGKKASEQPNDIKLCAESECPFKEVKEINGDGSETTTK